jgi:mannose-6-phosphate isomerase-like protein (cupin superfamily)
MQDALLVIRHAERPNVSLGGAQYTPILGDDTGAGLPLRTGIQSSPPGHQVRPHSHPYPEILTVLDGEGEAWLVGEAARVALSPGVTIVVPAGRVHCFRATGERPLVTFGIHTFAKRIVDYADAS